VNLRDVGLIQRREDFRFPLQPREAVAVGGKRVREHFDGNVRFRLVSVARYTSPIPPAPMRAAISYGPSRVPGVNAIPAGRFYALNSTTPMNVSRDWPGTLVNGPPRQSY
jgi:hypothetical protein